jgi:cation:H+ antiporter
MDYVWVIFGLILLFAGGEALIRGVVSVARKLNVSELVVGVTLIGLTAAVPELFTSLKALEVGAVGMAVGNVIGSNIANVLLILGLAALIRPVATNPDIIGRNAAVMLAATAVVCVLIYFNAFTRVTGIGLVAALIVFLGVTLMRDQKQQDSVAAAHVSEAGQVTAHYGFPIAGLLIVIGMVGIVFGANYVVLHGQLLARDLGVSDKLIGLTVLAVGTSLPEVFTACYAAARGRSDVALGAIIGANIFNLLGVLGIMALVRPFSLSGDPSAEAMSQVAATSVINVNEIGALILSVFLMVLFGSTGRQIARWEGALMVGAYLLFLGLLFGVVPVPAVIPVAGPNAG